MRDRWNHFPNSTVAKYEQLSQVVVLNTVDWESYDRAVRSEDILALRRIAPVLWHELRHWVDHCSTVWGQRDLVGAFEALSARAVGSEYDYWKIVEYVRRASKDRFDTYFTTIENDHPVSGTRGWMAHSSAGVRFDELGKPDESKPILFTRFARLDGSLACRVPLSVASLLEVSAMYFEWHMSARLAAKLPEPGATVQQEVIKEQLQQYLFTPSLAEYSVAVHLFANKQHLTDGLLAFEAAAALAFIALNLTDDLFSEMRVPETTALWGSRNRSFLDQKDRGYAYFLLTQAAPPINRNNSIGDWMDATVRAAGLPPLQTIHELAHSERARLRESVLSGSMADEYRKDLLRVLLKGEIVATRCIPFPTLDNADAALTETGMPAIQFSDLAVLEGRIAKKYEDAGSFYGWYEHRNKLVNRLSEFVDVCGL